MTNSVKLTAMAKAAGCAAKLNPAMLDAVLRNLPRQTDPNVLVGFDTNDDAGIYLLQDDVALVQTVDFFTPIVDDPALFGQIAAANALSDVYAMGGRPISALSIVAFPEKSDPDILEQIIRGGLQKMNEAKCSVIGGHSIRNEDMLFGYAVTGVIDPHRVWRNVGAIAGDVLLFTKPLGTGVITTALKKDRASPESLAAAIGAMTTLNRAAAAALRELEETAGTVKPVHAVTDVTGFSLLGHAREMALGDPVRDIEQVSLQVNYVAFEYLQGAAEAARQGHLSGGLKNNRSFIGDCVGFHAEVPPEYRDLLFDPQTSGGLLIAIAPGSAESCLEVLGRHGVAARRVGRVTQKRHPLISVE
ncbi:MAG TPA: selenide, water dikinase SelD [Candidatus Dormibacteraeota bacterium]|nr:selenide, water dikinase SelD [Candidatus Dormibacteraeota bacterium]